ncbi:hypothetical protein Q4566_15570 [Tamlana sp. 2_MG-2023]|uniref:hypothetical protein n=1 Tax=unclassified Tamlana TaxID=2614803 RepID=UPI0026E1D8E5|nr:MULTISPECIES: hypothetical protein [unclassified Tamlana]MDO6761626.1 hypothetical protein [Tamlana sp. 2_MG-2023]MDO6792452.1 hypothetical protein [Tamlana sp. 1_MG-2023]
MNYIRHLNGAFDKFYADKRLNTSHISLYMALFQFWNLNRFPEEFYIDRQEVMRLAKIGSLTTYHNCIKHLNKWKYIKYMPSHNPYKGSKIKMFNFGTSSKQVVNEYETSSKQAANNFKTSTEQALVCNTNINKHIENINKTKLPKNEFEVIDFFKKKKWPVHEAKKFYNHYQGIGWKIGGKIKIEEWEATASNWILKAKEFETKDAASQKKDNLRTTKNKDYGQPL